MAAPRIALFDLGNTLIYFDGHWPQIYAEADQALQQALEQMGYPLPDPDFSRDFRARLEAYALQRESEFIEYTTTYILRETLAAWGHPQVPADALQGAVRALYAVSQAYWLPEADAAPTLDTLRRAGFRLGLISNAGDDEDVQTLVDNAQLRPYFDVILTSAGTGIRKPNPRIFHMALEHWGAAPSQALMVGDTLGADILGARNSGIYSIWITRRADTPANHAHADTIRPDTRIETLAMLPDMLDGWGL